MGKFIHYPGNLYIRGDENHRYVINATAQIYPGKPNDKKLLDFKDDAGSRQRYFSDCLMGIAQLKNLESIAFPYKIGCGLAGGDWEFYKQSIENFTHCVEQKGAQVFIVKRSQDK